MEHNLLASKQASKQALDNCRFVKCVLMLLVILYHSFLFWNENWIGIKPVVPLINCPPLAIFCTWLNSFHIYAFTLVSGYIYAFIRFEKGGYTKYKAFIKNKAKRLLIPFVFCLLCWSIPIRIILLHPEQKILVDWSLLGENPEQLWFLLMLFWIFLMVYPFSSIINHSNIGAVIIAAGFYFLGTVGSHFIPNYYRIWTGFYFMPYFILGIKVRQTGLHIHLVIQVAFHIILFIASNYMRSLDGVFYKIVGKGTDFCLHLISALMAFSLLQLIAEKVKWKNSNMFMLLASCSMPMYLFHEQIAHITMVAFNGMNPYMHASLNFIISAGIS